jgi:hypothetical protein
MKKIIFILSLVVFHFVSSGQFAARMQVKNPIEGVCDNQNVYVIFPSFKGQEEAKCPASKKEITQRLNAEVSFLKDSTGYNDKGMVNVIINCKGEVVQCEIDNKTRHPELDKQIVAVFNSLGNWKPGKVNGDKVDTSRLWSFEIKNGVITIN